MDYIHLALITLYHVKVTNSRSKSYTLFKLKNYWERRYRCRENAKNVIIPRVKDEAYLLICIRLQTFCEQVTLPTHASLNLLTSGLHPFSSDHVKVTNSRSKSYTLFKPKNYWERRYRCREHTKNVIKLRVKDEAYLIALDCKLFVNRWHYQLVPQHIIFAEKEWIYIRHLSTLRLYELTYLFLVILCSRIDK